MSTTKPTKSQKGVRYTEAEKKEIIDFAVAYNATNGRGGQSKAAAQFGVSQLTVAAWLKGAGVAKPSSKKTKAPKAAKKTKAPKTAKAPKASGSKSGTRYTAEQKQEVVDFTVAYNAANGRGGQSHAAAKFNISPLTVMAWLKGAGVKGGSKKSVGKAKKALKTAKLPKASVSGNFDDKLNALLALRKEVTKAEAELAKLVAKFNAAKAAL